ncbi:MAG: hypothetical protein ACKO5E_21815 [bacterium]
MTDQQTGPASPLKITLRPRKSRPFFARHPWLFADSIAKVEGDSRNPAEASIYSAEGAFIARGLFNPASKLRVRLYRWADEPLDAHFWATTLEKALALTVTCRRFTPTITPEGLFSARPTAFQAWLLTNSARGLPASLQAWPCGSTALLSKMFWP